MTKLTRHLLALFAWNERHWHVYLKWNERLFHECYAVYLSGRSEKDPSEGWYKGEIGFFDFYIIPLAKKLENCGVFGVSSDECLVSLCVKAVSLIYLIGGCHADVNSLRSPSFHFSNMLKQTAKNGSERVKRLSRIILSNIEKSKVGDKVVETGLHAILKHSLQLRCSRSDSLVGDSRRLPYQRIHDGWEQVEVGFDFGSREWTELAKVACCSSRRTCRKGSSTVSYNSKSSSYR